MPKLPKTISVGVLTFLVVVFGIVLLALLVPVLLPTGSFGFAFAVSRRASVVTLIALLTLGATLIVVARALRRRRLN